MQGPAAYEPEIPPKIQAVLSYLQFCQNIRWGAIGGDGWKQDTARDLNKAEQRAYDAALATITEYFNQPGFGESQPPPREPPPPPDDPKERVPCPS